MRHQPVGINRRAAALAAGALVIACVATRQPGAAVTWTAASSAHFSIHTTSGEKRAREALTHFERVHAFFSAYLTLPPPTHPVQLIVFSGEREYAPYRLNDFAIAYYQPAVDRDYVVMQSIDADSESTVIHEYTHLVLRDAGAKYPAWLAEGLAEFFSTLEQDGNKVRLGRVPLGRLVELRKESPMPVAKLLAITQDSPEYTSKAGASRFYAQSWALSHMVMAHERYRAGAQQFLRLVGDGTPAFAAFDAVYHRSIAEVDRDLRQYLERELFPFFAADVPPPPPVTVAVQPTSTFDAELVLANLLAAQRGSDTRARDAYRALTRQKPDHAGLTEAMAFFELRAGRRVDATSLFARAILIGTNNAMAYAEYARLIGRSEPDRASSMFARALELAPDSIEVRMRAAGNQVLLRNGQAALDLVAGIDRVPEPLRYEFYQVLANAHALLANFDEAAQAAALVAENAHTADERRFAAELMQITGGPADMTVVVRGRLTDINCAGDALVLSVTTDRGALALVLDDRSKVAVPGTLGRVDLDCGPQDRPLRVGYADANPPSGTQGRVRFLDFRSPAAGRPPSH